jgi:hypothetical protein
MKRRAINYVLKGETISYVHDILRAADICDLQGIKAAVAADPLSVNYQDPYSGLSALMIVAGHGNNSCVDFLLSQEGIDPTLRDNEMRKAVDMANMIGRPDLEGLIFRKAFGDVLDEIENDENVEVAGSTPSNVVRLPPKKGGSEPKP